MSAPTLYEAVQVFMGQISAEYGRIIDEGADDMPVFVCFGKKDSYSVELKLSDLKRLDRAYAHAFESKVARGAKKAKGSLL